MKSILPFIFVFAAILCGCGSSKQQFQKGNYDAAIEMAIKQLRKDRGDTKQIEILSRSYQIANEKDNERINLLKAEGRPDSWDEVYIIYKKLSDRQSLVRTVTPLTLNSQTVDFTYVNYVPDMVRAKRSAADFYFAHAVELMKNGSKESYRQAYHELIRAKEYAGDYEGIDNRITESRYLGISRVLVAVKNNSMLNFPSELERDLVALDFPSLNSEWVEYYTQVTDKNTVFDYLINVNIKSIAVSPDQTLQRDTVIKRDVEDGFTYILDKRGNVAKDSLGNDIKTKKYKTLQCALVETIQSKACRIDGDVVVVRINTGIVLNRSPLGARSVFEYVSSRAIGDLNALNEDQRNRTKSGPVPFPSDIEMVLRCSGNLKNGIRGALQNNRQFIY